MIELFGKHRHDDWERPGRRVSAPPLFETVESGSQLAGGSWALDFERLREFPFEPSLENRVVGGSDAAPVAKEKLRMLAYRLQRSRRSQRLRSIVVTSAAPQEGKTLVAANLAMTLAHGGGRVLVIDADLRRPGMGNVFGVTNGPGLADCLSGAATLTESVLRLTPSGLYFLPAARPMNDPVDLLQTPQLGVFLQASEADFEWVIVDSPPIIPFTDANYLASAADGVILVARAGVTRPRDFEKAVQNLKGAYIVGTVLNGLDQPDQKGYYTYYTDRTETKE